MAEDEQVIAIDETASIAEVATYVEANVPADYKVELKQFILDKSIDGEVFLSLTEERLEKLGKEYDGKSIKLLGLVKKTRGDAESMEEKNIALSGPPIDFLSHSAVLEFLESHMSDVDKFHCIPHVIGEVGRSFKLSGREEAMCKAADSFKALLNNDVGREKRRIPVCSGISGLGKTRMLEEWETMFEIAEIPGVWLGVLVLYYNGHMPQPVEKSLTIEASFSWRLLHRLFNEGNGMEFDLWMLNCLPMNARDLTLKMALSVIRLKLLSRGYINDDDTLYVFLGIDEYQAINRVGGIPSVSLSKQPLLQDLLDILGNILASPVEGVRIFPMFAGTDLSVMSIANSSRTETIRMPMTFLSSVEVESAVASVPQGLTLLGYTPVRRHLFYFGGVARWTIQYVEKLIQCMDESKEDILSVETIEEVFRSVKLMYVSKWGVLS